MEVTNRPRKTCDLCYTRKLKCDRKTPRCSYCVACAKDCTHTAQSRKWKPKAQRTSRIKEKHDTQVLQTLGQQSNVQSQARVQDQPQNATACFQDRSLNDIDHATSFMGLPPLQECLDMLGIFLNSFNSVLPLFHADTLLRLVGECYAAPPQQRDPVAWAAINVVLALASQQMPADDSSGTGKPQTDRTAEYLNKAQSIISQLMLGELRLLNIQVLLGIVMVHQTAHDVTSSLILISGTMRLVHKLGLHNRAASAHLDSGERKQRDRVFWLAYILDKDLSLRAHQPSIQLDEDIDLELPTPSATDDGENDSTAGVVVTADGKTKMSFFLARMQLASIEGGVYDFLYSTRALNRNTEERYLARKSIVNALEHWRTSIPPEFGADVVASNTTNNPAYSGFFCVLHAVSLQCITLVHQSHAWDQQWVIGLRDYGRGLRTLQLPPAWDSLVRQARDFMILFRETWSGDAWFRWLTPCSYLTAMVLLIANGLRNLEHDGTKLESQLIDAALPWLDDMVGEWQKEEFGVFRDRCVEAAQQLRRRRAEAATMTLPITRGELLDNHGLGIGT